MIILFVKSFEISNKKISFSAEEIIPEIILNSPEKVFKNYRNFDLNKLLNSVKNFGEISDVIFLHFYDHISIQYTVQIDKIFLTNITPNYIANPDRFSYDFTAIFTGNKLQIYR